MQNKLAELQRLREQLAKISDKDGLPDILQLAENLDSALFVNGWVPLDDMTIAECKTYLIAEYKTRNMIVEAGEKPFSSSRITIRGHRIDIQ